MPFGLEATAWTALLQGVSRAQYNLLLGSGFSRDATDRQGRPLPSGPQLADELIAEFALEVPPGSLPLTRAYAACKDNPDRLVTFLRRRFTECLPADWMTQVTRPAWNSIYTLNIDDALERAYRRSSPTSAQDIKPLTWRDQYYVRAPGNPRVPIIHLHGSVAHAPKNDVLGNLVFDVSEYVIAHDARGEWHQNFHGDYRDKPFIVLGATLSEEYDLARVLEGGNHSQEITGFPSFMVVPHVDQFARTELQRWNLTPIEATAEEFFEQLIADLRNAEREAASTIALSLTEVPWEAQSFLSQFTKLKGNVSVRQRSPDAFFSGHEPRWEDIIAERDAKFSVVGNTLQAFQATAQMQRLVCIVGDRFKGKTTAMLRLARELSKQGFEPYTFRDELKLDVEAVLWAVRANPNLVLLFDGLADHAPEVGDLFQSAEKEGLSVTVLATERSSRLDRLHGSIPAAYVVPEPMPQMQRLGRSDVELLITKLDHHYQLQHLTGRDIETQVHHFLRDSKGDLFAGLLRLRYGSGFLARLEAQYRAVAEEGLGPAYSVCCLAYTLGHPVPAALLARAANVSEAELLAATRTGALTDVLEVERRGLKPKGRATASAVVEHVLRGPEVYQLALALSRALAPRISPETIGARTLASRINGELMRYNFIKNWVGRGQRAEAWYEELREEHGWNARYWEQRALAVADTTDATAFDRAENHAVRAVNILGDHRTLNTLGTVRMKKALAAYNAGHDEVWLPYWQAVRDLREAVRLAERRTEHPFVTFFEYTLRVCIHVRQGGDPVGQDVRNEWSRWIEDAERAPPFKYETNRAQLGAWNERWLNAALFGKGEE